MTGKVESTSIDKSKRPRKRRRRPCRGLKKNGEPCGSGAEGKTDFCVAHGGGKRCRGRKKKGEPCGSGAEGKTD